MCPERITQNVVKSHLETCQYSTEELKRLTWSQYTPEETRHFQCKVGSLVAIYSLTHVLTHLLTHLLTLSLTLTHSHSLTYLLYSLTEKTARLLCYVNSS